jgi:glycosyltransferase 2 family protein
LLLGLFFNNLLPARAGEAVRIVALHARAGTSRAESFATIVVERLMDVVALVLLFFVALPWLPRPTWLHAAALLALCVPVVALALSWVLARFGSRPIRFVVSPLARLPFISRERIEYGAESMVRGCAALRNARLATASFALTIASWLAYSASFWLVAVGFNANLPFSAGILLAVATGLALALPAGPAALGVFEAASILALTAYGVPRSEAFSAALVLHAVNFFPFLAAGAAVLVIWGKTSRQSSLGWFAGDSPKRKPKRQSETIKSTEQRDEEVVESERAAGDVLFPEEPAGDEPAEGANGVHIPKLLDLESRFSKARVKRLFQVPPLVTEGSVGGPEEPRMGGDEQ